MLLFVKRLLLSVGIISGILFICTYLESSFEIKIITKLLPSFVLCLYLLISKISKRNIFVFIGLLFSMIGDFLMIFDTRLFLSLGILVNLLGIICYLAYFINISKNLKLKSITPVLIIISVMYLLLFDNLDILKIPVLLYCLFFVLLVWRANVVKDSINNFYGYFLFLSAVSLIISDSILSLMLFKIINFHIKYYAVEMFLWWSGLFGLAIFSNKEKENCLTTASTCQHRFKTSAFHRSFISAFLSVWGYCPRESTTPDFIRSFIRYESPFSETTCA